MLYAFFHQTLSDIEFKVDRLQIIVVAKQYIYVSQLFISRMPKMWQFHNWFWLHWILYQLQNILKGATHHVSTVADNTYKWGK